MDNVTKDKISRSLSNQLGFSSLVCDEIVSDIFDIASELIIKDSHLTIKNFGSFNIKQKRSRPGRDLNNMRDVEIPSRRTITFTPSKSIKTKLNES